MTPRAELDADGLAPRGRHRLRQVEFVAGHQERRLGRIALHPLGPHRQLERLAVVDVPLGRDVDAEGDVAGLHELGAGISPDQRRLADVALPADDDLDCPYRRSAHARPNTVMSNLGPSTFDL